MARGYARRPLQRDEVTFIQGAATVMWDCDCRRKIGESVHTLMKAWSSTVGGSHLNLTKIIGMTSFKLGRFRANMSFVLTVNAKSTVCRRQGK